MTSVFLTPKDVVLTETVHGTLSNASKDYKEKKPTSCNVIATIYTWTRAL